MIKVTVESLIQHINNGTRFADVDLDIRCDLVMCLGFPIEKVAEMSVEQVYKTLDDAEEDEQNPEKYTNRFGIKCTKCGCEVGTVFNDHSDTNDSVCRCGHVDSYSEYYFDQLAEENEFNEKLNPIMKKLYDRLDVWSYCHKDSITVDNIRNNGYLIQEIEADDDFEFYMLDEEVYQIKTHFDTVRAYKARMKN